MKKQLLLFQLFVLIGLFDCNDKFNEELFIETLPNSNLNLFFQFTTISEHNLNQESSFDHYHLFPKQLGEIIKKFQINELHLTLTQGLWKYNSWGEPSIGNVASGVELSILYNDLANRDLLTTLWPQTTRSLSGLFCSSLNFINNQTSIEPKFTMKPEGHVFYRGGGGKNQELGKRLKYATLPSEIVCTENLTPWIKLLPCGKYKGLAQLLTNPSKLFDSSYNSIGIHFRHICLDGPKCTKIGVELKQTLSLVIDHDLHVKQKLLGEQLRWSFSSVLGSRVSSTCPIADKSLVYFDLNLLQGSDSLNIDPKPTDVIKNQKLYNENRNLYVYDVKDLLNGKVTQFDLTVKYDKKTLLAANKKEISLIKVHRYVTGTNQFNLGLKTIFETNNYGNKNIEITYLENIPWYFRVYLHTLKIRYQNTNEDIKPTSIHYVPGQDRQRSHHIEIKFVLRANSIANLNMKFENAFLKWNEFPPDAQHGHSINPAVVFYKLPATLDAATNHYQQYRQYQNYSLIYDSLQSKTESERQVRIYTETLLVNLPVPDFSMPYNVICLTCTVIAIGFGSIHNFTTRKFAFLESNSLPFRVKKFVLGLLKRKTEAKTE